MVFGLPITFLINIVVQNYLLKKHIKIAQTLNNDLKTQKNISIENYVSFRVDKWTNIKIDIMKIMYVEAMGNYVKIVYEDNIVKNTVIRDTISNIEKKTCNVESIFRCHKSYILNVGYIKNMTGDSQGLKIRLNNDEKIIPVSRNKISEYKSILDK